MFANMAQHFLLELGDLKVPVKVITERRGGARAATGKHGFILRIPYGTSQQAFLKHWDWFSDWARKVHQEQPTVFERFRPNEYVNGQTLTVGPRTYALKIVFEDRVSQAGRFLDLETIELKLSTKLDSATRHKSAKTLLSRLVAQDFLPIMTKRVVELNQQFYQKKINSVNLKYNASNWGSCSGKANLNFSTRLLFAPQEVIDYVIVHELAHLIEMNHSDRFWALVEKAMPNYLQHELWLKKNGKACDF
jgi:predicted metal-dependent hydrolase